MTAPSNVIRFPRSRLRVVQNAQGGLPDAYKSAPWREWQDFTDRNFATAADYMTAWGELTCQGALLTAESLRLFFKACDVAALHVPNNGRGPCAKENPRSPKLSPDDAA